MRKFAQNPSSFLDSDQVGESLAEFAADGPLFAELFETVSDAFEADENINIMESDDEIEQYINQKMSRSESEMSLETFKPSGGNEETPKRAFSSNDHSYRSDPSNSTAKAPIRIRLVGDNTNHLTHERRDRCMNKNAIMARENRQKKKQYVESLENKCERLTCENFALKTSIGSKDKQLESMAKEIEYLQNVLANETGLSALLKNINQTSGLNFGTSLLPNKSVSTKSTKRSRDMQENSKSSETVNKRSKPDCSQVDNTESNTESFEGPPTPCASPEPATSGGVCLHVSNNNVSLEFCSTCASNAAEVWKVSGDHNYNKAHKQHDSSDYVVVKQELADHVVIKQEYYGSDEENA